MFRLLKLAVFALIGYAIYELYLGVTQETQYSGRRAAAGSAGPMTGGGEGVDVETEDATGASMRHTVGRGAR